MSDPGGTGPAGGTPAAGGVIVGAAAGGAPAGGADSAEPAPTGRGPVRAVTAGVLAVLFLAAAVYCLRRGIVTDTWPPFLPDADSATITRYQGPWLTAAAVALLGAGLSIMALVLGLQDHRGDRRE